MQLTVQRQADLPVKKFRKHEYGWTHNLHLTAHWIVCVSFCLCSILPQGLAFLRLLLVKTICLYMKPRALLHSTHMHTTLQWKNQSRNYCVPACLISAHMHNVHMNREDCRWDFCITDFDLCQSTSFIYSMSTNQWAMSDAAWNHLHTFHTLICEHVALQRGFLVVCLS